MAKIGWLFWDRIPYYEHSVKLFTGKASCKIEVKQINMKSEDDIIQIIHSSEGIS